MKVLFSIFVLHFEPIPYYTQAPFVMYTEIIYRYVLHINNIIISKFKYKTFARNVLYFSYVYKYKLFK